MKSGIEIIRHDRHGLMGLEEGLDCVCGSRAKGEANCLDSSIEECMDYSDDQLENIILSGGLCDGQGDAIFQLMNDLKTDEDLASLLKEGYESNIEHTNLTIPIIIDARDLENVASYIEISNSQVNVLSSPFSSPSYNTDYSQASSPASASPSTVCSSINTTSSIKPAKQITIKRSSARRTKRPKRIHDDRVKHQNKMAAIKYRVRKKQEQDEIDKNIQLEEDKNKKLREHVKELKVQIKVIKDFVNKFLDGKKVN